MDDPNNDWKEWVTLYAVLKLNRMMNKLERVGGVLCQNHFKLHGKKHDGWCFSEEAPSNYIMSMVGKGRAK